MKESARLINQSNPQCGLENVISGFVDFVDGSLCSGPKGNYAAGSF